MWFGHLIVGLIIAVPFGFDAVAIALGLFFSWLPNVDALIARAGIRRNEFHDGPTHSIAFAIIIGGIVSLVSPIYGLIAFLGCFLHCLSDMPTNSGVPLFYPLSKKRITLNLWSETGFWGIQSIRGYYSQKWAKLSELFVVILLLILLVEKFVF